MFYKITIMDKSNEKIFENIFPLPYISKLRDKFVL